MASQQKVQLNLQKMLLAIAERYSATVYYEPTSTVKIKYPAIIYKKTVPQNQKADGRNYISYQRFEITVWDRDPNSEIPFSITEEVPFASINNTYVSNNMHCTVIQVYMKS